MDFCDSDEGSRNENLTVKRWERIAVKRKSLLDETIISERKSGTLIVNPNLADKSVTSVDSASASNGLRGRDKPELKNRYNCKNVVPLVVLISQNFQSDGLGGARQGSIGSLHPMIIGKWLRNIDMGIVEPKRKGRDRVEVTLPSYQLANKLVSVQGKSLPPSWTTYIPDNKILRVEVARDVEPSLSGSEVLENID